MKKTTIASLFVITALVSGCSVDARVAQRPVLVTDSLVTRVEQPRGVSQYVWEEPMADVIDVPPGLDAEGIYYRPAHEAVVEVRQGRWSPLKAAKRSE